METSDTLLTLFLFFVFIFGTDILMRVSETSVRRKQREMASMFCHKRGELFNITMLIQENMRYTDTPRKYIIWTRKKHHADREKM